MADKRKFAIDDIWSEPIIEDQKDKGQSKSPQVENGQNIFRGIENQNKPVGADPNLIEDAMLLKAAFADVWAKNDDSLVKMISIHGTLDIFVVLDMDSNDWCNLKRCKDNWIYCLQSVNKELNYYRRTMLVKFDPVMKDFFLEPLYSLFSKFSNKENYGEFFTYLEFLKKWTLNNKRFSIESVHLAEIRHRSINLNADDWIEMMQELYEQRQRGDEKNEIEKASKYSGVRTDREDENKVLKTPQVEIGHKINGPSKDQEPGKGQNSKSFQEVKLHQDAILLQETFATWWFQDNNYMRELMAIHGTVDIFMILGLDSEDYINMPQSDVNWKKALKQLKLKLMEYRLSVFNDSPDVMAEFFMAPLIALVNGPFSAPKKDHFFCYLGQLAKEKHGIFKRRFSITSVRIAQIRPTSTNENADEWIDALQSLIEKIERGDLMSVSGTASIYNGVRTVKEDDNKSLKSMDKLRVDCESKCTLVDDAVTAIGARAKAGTETTGWEQTTDFLSEKMVFFRSRVVPADDALVDTTKSLQDLFISFGSLDTATFHGIIFTNKKMDGRFRACKIPFFYVHPELTPEKIDSTIDEFHDDLAVKYSILLVETDMQGQLTWNIWAKIVQTVKPNKIKYIRMDDVTHLYDIESWVNQRSTIEESGLYIDVICSCDDRARAEYFKHFLEANRLDAPKEMDDIEKYMAERMKVPKKYGDLPPVTKNSLCKKIDTQKEEKRFQREENNMDHPIFTCPPARNYFSRHTFKFKGNKISPDDLDCEKCHGKHLVSKCPEGGSLLNIKQGVRNQEGKRTGNGPSLCFACNGQYGHNSSNCPHRHPHSFDEEFLCWNCARPEHNKRDCPYERYNSDQPLRVQQLLPPSEIRQLVNGDWVRIGKQFPELRKAQRQTPGKKLGLHY